MGASSFIDVLLAKSGEVGCSEDDMEQRRMKMMADIMADLDAVDSQADGFKE